MAKKIKKEDVAVEETPIKVVEEAPIADAPVKETIAEEAPKAVPISEVQVTGHFYVLRRGEGFVVVNRSGQIVSRQLPEVKAKEMVQRFEGLTR